jgi:hypothetical protein
MTLPANFNLAPGTTNRDISPREEGPVCEIPLCLDVPESQQDLRMGLCRKHLAELLEEIE